jgi:NAD(P)-dependent dehydrogenase (short-subunit alcohol dehydrogenase family)
MAARGFGRVVCTTSGAVRQPIPDFDLSTAPCLALTGYVAGVAHKVAARGVTLNCVLPGPIQTERISELGAVADRMIAEVPMGCTGTPEEFAAAQTASREQDHRWRVRARSFSGRMIVGSGALLWPGQRHPTDSGSPQTADDLLQPASRQPWAAS